MMLMILFSLSVLVGGSMVHERELKRLEAKHRSARRMDIRRNKRRSNLSSVIQIENNVLDKRKGPGRPKNNICPTSKAMNFIRSVFQFSGSNQFISNDSKYGDLVKVISILMLYYFIYFHFVI